MLDAVNRKILLALLENSRQPISQLARKIRISREVAKYRIKKLQEEGVIVGFITHIDSARLGYSHAAAFLTIKRNREEELKDYIKRSEFTAWSGEFSGVWSLGTDIFGSTSDEIHKNFITLYKSFGEDIIDHKLRIYESTTFLPEKYLDEQATSQQIKHKEHKVDATDRRILKILSRDSRADTVGIGKVVSLTAAAVTQRIRRLENAGIIQQYSLHLDVSKIGIYTYSVFAVNKKIDQRERLSKFLTQHSNVVFIAEYVGDPYIEFGLAVKDPYELREVVQSIEEAHPDNRIVEVFLIQKDILPVGPPNCVFE